MKVRITQLMSISSFDVKEMSYLDIDSVTYYKLNKMNLNLDLQQKALVSCRKCVDDAIRSLHSDQT